jgi:hypothetical protein
MTKEEKLLNNLNILIGIADKSFDGHLSIMKFTTGWKVLFDTPELSRYSYENIKKMTNYDSLESAVEDVTKYIDDRRTKQKKND